MEELPVALGLLLGLPLLLEGLGGALVRETDVVPVDLGLVHVVALDAFVGDRVDLRQKLVDLGGWGLK